MRSMSLRLMSVSILILAAAGFLGGCADEAEYQRQRDAAVQQRDVANQTAIDASAALEKAKAAIAELEASKLALQKDSATRAAGFDDQVARLQAQISALEVGSTERTKAEALAVELQKLITNQRESASSSAAAINEQIAKARVAAETASAAASEAKGRAAAMDERVKSADKEAASASDDTAANSIGALIGAVIPGAGAVSPILLALGIRQLRLSKAIDTLTGKLGAAKRVVQSIDALAEVSPTVKDAIQANKGLLDKVQQPEGKAFVDAAQGYAKPTTTAAV